MRNLAIPGLLMLLFLARPIASQVTDDKLIVPGQRIGKWTLEMTIDQIAQMNGRRSFQGATGNRDEARSFRVHCWGTGQTFCAGTQDGQKVEWMTSTDDQFKTDKGIGVGTPRTQAESVYGTPTAVTEPSPGETFFRVIWDEVGLAVSVGGGGNVGRLFIFRVGAAKTLWKF